MHIFLTSSPSGPLDGSRQVNGLDDKNQFVDQLRTCWKQNSRCLMISAFPSLMDSNNEMISFFRGVFEYRGFSISCFDLWDDRTIEYSKDSLQSYDVILLGGGHVPTQNHYFQRIHLRELFEGYDGTVIGISAGSMNSADEVYSQPEENGESLDPNYVRHLQGLNLTKTKITPHVQMVRYYWLDGKRLYEDILFPDTYGMPIIGLVDGSYLYIHDQEEWIYGEAYCIEDGTMRKICEENQVLLYKRNGERV